MRKKTTEDVENVVEGAEAKTEKKTQKRKTSAARKTTTTRKKDAAEKAGDDKNPDAETTEKAGKQQEKKYTRRGRKPAPKAKKEIEAIVATLQQENAEETVNPVEAENAPVAEEVMNAPAIAEEASAPESVEETPTAVEDATTPDSIEDAPVAAEETPAEVEETDSPAPVEEAPVAPVEETAAPEPKAPEPKAPEQKAETAQIPKQEKRRNEQKPEQKQQNVKPIPPFTPVRVETLVDLVNAPYRQLCLNDQQIQQLTVEDAQQRFRWFEGTLAWVLNYDIVISDTNIWLELLVGHTSSHSDPKVNARLLFERQLEFISKLVRFRGGKFMMMSETYEEIDRFATQQAPTNYKDADFTDEALCRNVAARLAKRLILSQQRENRLRIEGIGAESHHAAFADPAIIRKTVELFATGKRVLLITNDASVGIRSMGMCDDLQRHNNIDDETWEEVYTPLRPMVMTMDDLKVLDNFTRQYHFLQMAAGKQWMEDVPRRMEKHNVEPLMLWMEGFRPGDKHSEMQRQQNAQQKQNGQKQGNAQQKQNNAQQAQQKQSNTQQKQKAQKQQQNAQPKQEQSQDAPKPETANQQQMEAQAQTQPMQEVQPKPQQKREAQPKQAAKGADAQEKLEQVADPVAEQAVAQPEIAAQEKTMSPSELIADCNNSVADPATEPKKRPVRRRPVRRRPGK